jgi:uncharacterized membrane protein YciS (DUF1049 family)
MRIVKLLALLLVAALGFSFAWLNAQYVAFDYYLHSIQIRLSYLLALFLVLGWIFGVISMLRPYWRVRAKLRGILKQNRLAEQQTGEVQMPPANEDD